MNKNKIEITISTINWNVSDKLKKSIDSFLKTYKDLNYIWFIIDNNSQQLGFSDIMNRYSENKRLIFIKNNKNEGLAVLNKVINKAKGRYWVFLDPDTYQKGAPILELIRFMETNPDAGMASAKQLNPDNTPLYYYATSWTINKYFFLMTSLGKSIDQYFFSKKMKKYYAYSSLNLNLNKVSQIDQVPFACTIMRMELIHEEGYIIDPDFSLSYNDVDLCKRIKDRGYNIYLVPTAEIFHDHSSSYKRITTPSRYNESRKCQVLYYRKHYKKSFWFIKLFFITEILISLIKRKLMKYFNIRFKNVIYFQLKIREYLKW